jgi:Regulator of chromosome condensation (RCC1) repeat
LVHAGSSWLLLAACADTDRPPPVDLSTRTRSIREVDADACTFVSEGCPCSEVGKKIGCGNVKERVAGYLWCSVGERICEEAGWSSCLSERVIRQRETSQLQALGASQSCAEENPCDPNCNAFVDDAVGLEPAPDSGVINKNDTLVLEAHPLMGGELCTSIELTASSDHVTVSSIEPLTATDLVVTAHALPTGCAPDPLVPVWAVDDFGFADVSPQGDFRVLTPRAGRVTVTAFAGDLSGSLDVEVRISVLDAGGGPAGATAWFDDSVTAPDDAAWLYPYADTVFPLGLPPPLLQWQGRSGVAATNTGGCSVVADGTVRCWGQDTFGEGQGQAGPYDSIAGFGDHVCALTPTGSAECWGRNDVGQSDSHAGPFASLSVGGAHSCGLDANGNATCWGDDSAGQASPPPGPFTFIAAGEAHTCAILQADDDVVCWGDDQYGQSGGHTGTFTRVTTGARHTCALRASGTIECWGDNGSGQTAAPSGHFAELEAGDAHTCALALDGSVSCWGDDQHGQLDAPAGSFLRVTAAHNHSCAVHLDDAVECWGDSSTGQDAGVGGGAVKVSLRYPVTGTALFDWSIIAPENASFALATAAGPSQLLPGPRLRIPAPVWAAFEQTARGGDALLTLQRHTGEKLLGELPRRIHFATDTLKGRIVYQAYGTPQVTNVTGTYEAPSTRFGAATLALYPGSDKPTVIAGFDSPPGSVGRDSGCRSCHSVSRDGSSLITSYQGMKYGVHFTPSDGPNGGTPLPSGAAFEGVFLWSAPYPDGSFAFSHSGPTPCDTRVSTWVGSCLGSSYTAPPSDLLFTYRRLAAWPGGLTGSPWLDTDGDTVRDAAPTNQLFDLTPGSQGQPLTLAGLPASVRAAMPAFSPEGDRLVFNHYAGTLPLTDGGDAVGDRRSLALADFDVATKTLSRFRKLTVASDEACDVSLHPSNGCTDVWPSVLPGGAGVVFEREVFNNGAVPGSMHADFGGTRSACEVSDVEACRDGTKGELWWVPFDDQGEPLAPEKLVAASGEVTEGHLVPGDQGHNAQVEPLLSYEPAASPKNSGGYSWVAFTSRRRFGNVATSNPWASDPRFSPLLGKASPKKLWLTGISKTQEGNDVSTPALYLPGQEFEASNGKPRWVESACVAPAETPGINSECRSNSDCCGAPDTSVCSAAPGSSDSGGRKFCYPVAGGECIAEWAGLCTADEDCCDSDSGARCASGVCRLPPRLTTLENGTYTRDFEAVCPRGMEPVWQLLEWQANVPDETRIDFRASSTDDRNTLAGAPLADLGSAGPGQDSAWANSGINIHEALVAAGATSNHFLRVEMRLFSDATGTASPSLSTWRVLYDCLDAE